jgi:BlaI family penicillinase repressor
MLRPRPSKAELRVLEILWVRGASSVREIHESFPEKTRPAYTTVQTLVYRLEAKKALRRVRKAGSVNLFEPLVSRATAQRNLIDDFLALFGGQTQPMMTQLIESGRLTLEDIQAAEKTLNRLKEKKP